MKQTVKPSLYSPMVPSLTDEDLRKIGGGKIKIDARVEFAPEEIIKLEKSARKKVLSRIGAYVRRVIRNSIRTVKDSDKPSKPGSPPHSHGIGPNGLNLKRSILFDADDSSVAIGPLVRTWQDVGAIHEFGGIHNIRWFNKKNLRKLNVGDIGPISTGRYKSYASPHSRNQPLRDPRDGSYVAVVKLTSQSMADHATRVSRRMEFARKRYANANYPARPFVGPAFNRSKPHLAEFWRGAITT